MIIKCITTVIPNPSAALLRTGWWHADGYLTIGKKYEVYAIQTECYDDIDAYLICDDLYDEESYYWPLYMPTCYFEIIDSYIPSSWILSSRFPGYNGPIDLMPDNYELLLAGDLRRIKAFQRIKNQSGINYL